MLGVIEDAEDVVHDVYEKWISVDEVKDPKAYLGRMVINQSIKRAEELKKLVAYYRASSFCAPIDVQCQSIRKYAQVNRYGIVAEFTDFDYEGDDTPELVNALRVWQEGKTKLIIAQLECLPSNFAFVTNALRLSIDCISLDHIQRTGSTINALNMIAEYWR